MRFSFEWARIVLGCIAIATFAACFSKQPVRPEELHPVSLTPGQARDQMRRTLTGFEWRGGKVYGLTGIKIESLAFRTGHVAATGHDGHGAVVVVEWDLEAIETVHASEKSAGLYVGGKITRSTAPAFKVDEWLSNQYSGSREAVGKFIAANNRLADLAASLSKPDDFHPSGPVTTLSEEGNRHRVIAESAFREKNVEKAIEHFEAALETDPAWPDGNFNLALLYGETGEPALAARYMKRYLLLVPDSKDAKAAKEKIIVWEDAASRATP